MGIDSYFRDMGYGIRVVGHCDIDPHARQLLHTHTPAAFHGVDLNEDSILANLPYDILAAGFPCQPVSVAGKQRAHTDHRWLIHDICTRYLKAQTPPLAIFENVPGLLNYGRHADGSTPMGHVLTTLADAGYDARWTTVAASDAGFCHRRERVFIAATPTDADSVPVWAQPFSLP